MSANYFAPFVGDEILKLLKVADLPETVPGNPSAAGGVQPYFGAEAKRHVSDTTAAIRSDPEYKRPNPAADISERGPDAPGNPAVDNKASYFDPANLAVGQSITVPNPVTEHRANYFQKYEATQKELNEKQQAYWKELNRWWTPILAMAVPTYGQNLYQRGSELMHQQNLARQDYYSEVGRLPASHYDTRRGLHYSYGPGGVTIQRLTAAEEEQPPTTGYFDAPEDPNDPSSRVIRYKQVQGKPAEPAKMKVKAKRLAGPLPPEEAKVEEVETEENIPSPISKQPKDHLHRGAIIKVGGELRHFAEAEEDPKTGKLVGIGEGEPVRQPGDPKDADFAPAMSMAYSLARDELGRDAEASEVMSRARELFPAIYQERKKSRAAPGAAADTTKPPANQRGPGMFVEGQDKIWRAVMVDEKGNKVSVQWDPKTGKPRTQVGGREVNVATIGTVSSHATKK